MRCWVGMIKVPVAIGNNATAVRCSFELEILRKMISCGQT